MTDKPNIIDPKKPIKSAERFKSKCYPYLLNQQDEWLSWNGSCYQPIEDATVMSKISKFLAAAKVSVMTKDGPKLVPFNPKSNDIREVCGSLKNICHQPRDTMSPPTWLQGTPPEY